MGLPWNDFTEPDDWVKQYLQVHGRHYFPLPYTADTKRIFDEKIYYKKLWTHSQKSGERSCVTAAKQCVAPRSGLFHEAITWVKYSTHHTHSQNCHCCQLYPTFIFSYWPYLLPSEYQQNIGLPYTYDHSTVLLHFKNFLYYSGHTANIVSFYSNLVH